MEDESGINVEREGKVRSEKKQVWKEGDERRDEVRRRGRGKLRVAEGRKNQKG